jgi:hypothetical protein
LAFNAGAQGDIAVPMMPASAPPVCGACCIRRFHSSVPVTSRVNDGSEGQRGPAMAATAAWLLGVVAPHPPPR